MRRMPFGTVILAAVFAAVGISQGGLSQTLPSPPGTGTFLLLSDLHFDPFGDPAIMQRLAGTRWKSGCASSRPGEISRYGSDTNTLLLKSALANAAATAAANHLHYDYIIVAGDFLAHDFDEHYQECVGGGKAAYSQFTSDTIALVTRMIRETFPGVPIFAALGNNDTDLGDYAKPSAVFLKAVGETWSSAWGKTSLAARRKATATFEKAGSYAVPHPAVPSNEIVVLNSNLWSSANDDACSESSPDPGGQFAWLTGVLREANSARDTATLVMHVPPGVDVNKSVSHGQPEPLWTAPCAEKFFATLHEFPGVVREIYAGHIHRDDFRLLKDPAGRPFGWVHILASVSPVYDNNPAIEIGEYDRETGELTDYTPVSLNLREAKPAWTVEYTFTSGYGYPRISLSALDKLTTEIHSGNPRSGVGKQYADRYTAGAGAIPTPEDWLIYSCAQTELTLSAFAKCASSAAPAAPAP